MADLLEEKIKHSNIKDYFPDFQGDPRKLEDVQSFIFRMFDDRRREKSKALFHFFTAANNTEYFKFIFAVVKDIILENNLKSFKTY
jgi:guanine nucleotide-binding protein subunit alpha-12